MQTHVTLEIERNVAFLTFGAEQPGKPPTLDHAVLNELAADIAAIRDQIGQLRAVVVRSATPRYFVVGANIHALKLLDAQTIVPWIQHGHAVLNELAALPLPVIARVDGFALGGGLELALACDLIVAAETARLGQPEANLGLVAGWGGSFRLPRRVGPGRAKWMFFTARILEAQEAYNMGLVDVIASAGELDAAILSILESIRQVSPLSVKHLKHLVDRSTAIALADSLAGETAVSSDCMTSADTRERVARYLDSRQGR
jgi:enoyl-CoA hydratase